MANDVYKQSGDKTPFAPLFATPADTDPDNTLNGPRPFAGSNWPSLGSQGGRTNRANQEMAASRQADSATSRAQSADKAAKLKLSKKKRGK